MPNLVVYVPMNIWSQLQAKEGLAVKKVARSVANRALEQYVLTGSAPVGSTPLSPSTTVELPALTAAAGGAGADELDEDDEK